MLDSDLVSLTPNIKGFCRELKKLSLAEQKIIKCGKTKSDHLIHIYIGPFPLVIRQRHFEFKVRQKVSFCLASQSSCCCIL